jgi:hypothetical protein
MFKMVALKRFRYPSGPTGREYKIGDDVTVLSERDARALRLIRVAKDAPQEASKSTASAGVPKPPAPQPPPPPPPEPPPPAPPMTTENTEALVPRRSRYRRRDMQPDEGSDTSGE